MGKTILFFEVIGDCERGFGLSVRLPSGQVRKIDSVAFERDSVEALCERMNRLGVSECHIDEIVEDFLP